MSIVPSSLPRNLWEKTNLVLGNGFLHKTGKLQALKPLSALGEFDLTRVGDTGTYVNESGIVTPSLANTPRIDWSTGFPRVMLEPQSTNLLANREVMANESIIVSATAHTLSFYGVGTVTLSGAATATLTGTGPNTRVTLTFTPAAGTLNITVVGSCTKGQIEALPYATSYIYSLLGATATRGQDFCSKSGISSLISQNEGTLFVDFIWQGRSVIATDSTIASIGLQSFGDSYIAIASFNDFIYARIAIGTAVQFTLNGFAMSRGQRIKAALAYKNNDVCFAINGNIVGTNNTSGVPPLSQIFLNNFFPNSKQLNQLKIDSIRFSNSELQKLTAL